MLAPKRVVSWLKPLSTGKSSRIPKEGLRGFTPSARQHCAYFSNQRLIGPGALRCFDSPEFAEDCLSWLETERLVRKENGDGGVGNAGEDLATSAVGEFVDRAEDGGDSERLFLA
jgi:hypothetical protein